MSDRIVDQKQPRFRPARVVPAVPGPRSKEESLPLRYGERARTVVELVLDLPLEHVTAVAVGAPLLPRRTGLVLDDRPALSERRDRPGMDVRLVVRPVDRLEVEPS